MPNRLGQEILYYAKKCLIGQNKGCGKSRILLLEVDYAKTTGNRNFRLSANERDNLEVFICKEHRPN